MAIVKRYNLRGMATKIDDLYKEPEFATDTLNVYKDWSGRIIGRNGTLKYLSLTCDDMYYSREKLEHYAFSDVMKKSTDGVTFSNVPSYFSTNSGKINQSIKSQSENSGYVYFSDTELVNPVMKYDGYGLYQAGLPELPVSVSSSGIPTGNGFNVAYTSGATKVYLKMCLYSIGVFGEVYFGPVTSVNVDCNTASLGAVSTNCLVSKNINSVYGSLYDEKTFSDNTSITSIVGSTITFSTVDTNYVAGDFLTVVKSATGEFFQSKIVSVDLTGKTIVVSDDISAYDSIVPSRYGYVVFVSSDNVDFRLYKVTVLTPDNSMTSAYTPTGGGVIIADIFANTSLYPSIDEYFSIEDSRVHPIKCKYLSNFGDLLFSLNLQDEVNSITKSSALPYSICFSSQGEGSSAETFNYSNIITVGTSDEGEITGASVVDNNMIIFKERSTYLLTLSSDGTPGRLIKLSSIVGCVSNKSIVNFEGSVAWVSDKGIYAQAGSKEPQELTAQIENIFTDNPYSLNFTNSRVAIDRFNELLMFYIPHTSDSSLDRVLVFSFKWKEWFWFMSIDGSNGFYHTGSTVYFNNSTQLSRIDNTSNNDVDTIANPDTSVAVNHYYKSGWENLGAAGVEKKFINMLVFSIQNPSAPIAYKDWKVKIFSDYDWNSATSVQCDDEKSFLTTNRRNFVNIDKTACYSRRFTFQNNNASEGFELSGYEFEAQQPQQRIRD